MFCFELLANVFASGVAPYYSIIVWFSCFVPAYDGLSLIGNSQTNYLFYIKTGVFLHFGNNSRNAKLGIGNYLEWIMF